MRLVEQGQRETDELEDLLPLTETETDDDVSSLGGSVTRGDRPEPQGVADADELLASQIEDGSEDLGLDVETGVDGGIEPSALVEGDDDELAGSHDQGVGVDETLEALEVSGDEDGWIEDSEGDSELYQHDFGDDDTEGHGDDGGLEGTETMHGADDPLHDGLDDALPPLAAEPDGEDTLSDEIEADLLREIGQDA